jgi:hypothetical protein
VIKHREVIGGGGFFETQVDVIEKEEVITVPNNDDKKIPRKDEKIFAFSGFSEFRTKYFSREVDPLEELTRMKNVKDARQKYAKRFNNGSNALMNQQ